MGGRVKGTFYVLICVALWALIPVVSKMGQATLDNHQFLFWSSLVSLVVLSLAAFFSGTLGEIKDYSPKEWGYLVFLGLLGTYIYYLFLYLGYSRAAGMEVLIVQYTWPIFIVILSIFILKERLNPRKVTAIILGFMGVILVLTKGKFQGVIFGNFSVMLLVGAGAFCFALFSVLSKKVNKEPLGVISVYFFSACVASFLSMLFYSKFALPSVAEIVPVLLNGILVNGFSYLFWQKALKSTQASYLAPFIFITPVVSAIYLILFFDEPMVFAYALGLICVVSGGLVNSIPLKKTK
jgi:drug/metabolite transporter (DMT)-like permease